MAAEQKFEVVSPLLTGYAPGDIITEEDAGGPGPIAHLTRTGQVKKVTAPKKPSSKGGK